MNYRRNSNILLEEYKAIFYSIPKNGCTSMKVQLVDILGMQKADNFPNNIHNPKIYNFPYVPKQELVTTYRNHLRFCFSRNPWDRLVSCFKDKIRSPDTDRSDFINGVARPLAKTSTRFYGGMSFEKFVDVVCDLSDELSERHFSSQLYQITDKKGNLLVNYIGQLEQINESLLRIASITGIPFSDFPHLHKTKRENYCDYYTDSLVEKVRQRFASDIAFFGYKFNDSNPAIIGLVEKP